MATTKGLIESALRTIGVLASGEEAKPSEVVDAIELANQMLASWSNEGLVVYSLTHETFDAPAARSVTIGPGGDIDTVRPIKIESVTFKDPGGIETPVNLMTLSAWKNTPVKDVVVSAPSGVYYEPTFPRGLLMFNAIPTSGNGETFTIVSFKELAELPGLTQQLQLPPGYERLIRLGLAIEVAPEYGANINPLIFDQYRSAKIAIKRTNSATRGGTLRVDSGILNRGSGYDINSGP